MYWKVIWPIFIGNIFSRTDTNFTIGVTLSGYPVNAIETGVTTSLLGSHGKIIIDKMQCSFDFMFVLKEDLKNSIRNK